MIKHRNNAAYELASAGIRESLKQSGVPVVIKEYMCTQDKCVIIKEELTKPDLIFTLGTQSTRCSMNSIHDIPILFSMVLDPEESGLNAENLTGVSLNIPFKEYGRILKKIFRKNCTIGVLYNPEENASFVKEAAEVARSMQFKIKSSAIVSLKDFNDVSHNLLTHIDVFWFIADTVVCQPVLVKKILQDCFKHKVPVIGLSPYYVKAGALFSLNCDYKDIGRQAGELGIRILQGEKPGDIQVNAPRKIVLYLNQTVAERLSVRIPVEVRKEAHKVFGE